MGIESFGYTIKFASPFIISAAVSDPAYDTVSLLSDGVPFIPSSTFGKKLKAVIRNHCCENAATWNKYKLCSGQLTHHDRRKYCPDDSIPERICPLCRIFGSPGGLHKSGFDFESARMEKPWYTLFKNLTDKYTSRARNRIDPSLRRATEDALFFAGLADVPVPLKGKIEELNTHTDYSNEIRTFDLSLILLGIRLVTEIGGSINRGHGECTVEPEGIDWKAYITNHVNAWKRAKTNTGGGQ